MGSRTKRGVDTWEVIRSMVGSELERFRTRYPHSRRRHILERLHAAAVDENEAELIAAGRDYFTFTAIVPPGCYATCPSRAEQCYLGGERVSGRKRGEAWAIRPYNYQVWR
jgi:hypothetical protein